MKKLSTVNQPEETNAKPKDWRNFFLLIFVILPLIAVCAIGAYGFFIWFMQLLFWGPPS